MVTIKQNDTKMINVDDVIKQKNIIQIVHEFLIIYTKY